MLALVACSFLVFAAPHARAPLASAMVREDPLPEAVVSPGTSRAWALLASSVLFERNGARHDMLAGADNATLKPGEIKSMLKDSWDIETRGHLLEQLEWLRTGGHRAAWEKHFRDYGGMSEKEIDARSRRIEAEEDRVIWKTLWKNASRAAKFKGGLIGWDLARYVALCRWGYAAGYLTQEEAWKRMDPVVKDLQKAYTSWEELGEAYCIGYDCWRPGKGESTEKAFERLKTADDSPWKTTPWKLKLVSLEKPEKPPKKP
jgi:hypothetical protein